MKEFTEQTFKIEVTEKEMILILKSREEFREKEEISKRAFLRKWVFNKYTFFDFKTAIIRESAKIIFTVYILNQILKNR